MKKIVITLTFVSLGAALNGAYPRVACAQTSSATELQIGLVKKGPDYSWKVSQFIAGAPSGLPASQGPNQLQARSETGQLLGSHGFNRSLIAFSEQIDPQTGSSNMKIHNSPPAIAAVRMPLPDQASFLEIIDPLDGTQSRINLQFLKPPCGNSVCNYPYESHLSCPEDCPSNSRDHFCNSQASDGCDPDCFSRYNMDYASADPDCTVPAPTVCTAQKYCFDSALFHCEYAQDGVPTSIFEEYCRYGCVTTDGNSKCAGVDAIALKPACSTDQDCVVNGQHWSCDCGVCRREPQGMCCFRAKESA